MGIRDDLPREEDAPSVGKYGKNNGFPRVFGQLGLGQQKPREKPNKPKKTKKTILNGLTQDSSHRIGFFVFFGFPRILDSWAWDSKNLEKNQINQKNQKKTNPEWTYPRFFSQDCFFFVFFGFFGFPRVFGQLGLGQQKPREKPNKPKKTKKNNPEWTYPRFFSQDCFFCFFWFFWFSSSFWTVGLGTAKTSRKTK